MATPTILPDGTKCYSGPTCLRHGTKTLSPDFLKKNLNDKLAELDSLSNPLAKLTPINVDEHLAELYYAEQEKMFEISEKVKRIKKIETEVEKYSGEPEGYHYKTAVEALKLFNTQLKVLKQELNNIRSEAAPYETEYQRRGWNRAFLVDNTNGHVHKDMYCSTCFPTTKYTWLPAYSGADEQTIVQDAGEKACTVCYPTAPVDVLKRPSKMEAPEKKKAREEREAARQKKAEETAAKSITLPDGSLLKTKFGGTLRTERTASIEAVDAAMFIYAVEEGNVYQEGQINESFVETRRQELNLILSALAHKHGTSIKAESEAIREKAVKKFKKSYKNYF